MASSSAAARLLLKGHNSSLLGCLTVVGVTSSFGYDHYSPNKDNKQMQHTFAEAQQQRPVVDTPVTVRKRVRTYTYMRPYYHSV
jgi:hypothetical protein